MGSRRSHVPARSTSGPRAAITSRGRNVDSAAPMQRHLIVVCAGAIACGASEVQQAAPAFDGQRAFEHVRELVALGPRPAGSPALERTRNYITTHLQTLGLSAESQAFDAAT